MIVWVASHPRSGNTFFRLLLHTLYGQETYSIYDDRELEQMGMASILGHRRRPGLPSMRREERIYFVKTHKLPSDDSPTIYLVRDGRDASVSLAHFLMNYEPVGFNVRLASKLLRYNRFEVTLEGVVRKGIWQSHVLAWTSDHRSVPMFVLHYEDLIADPVRWSQAALAAVGISLEPSGAAPLTFDALHARWPQFFRKGRVGSWREEMPDDIHEMFWRRSRAAMLRLGYVDDMPSALKAASPVANWSSARAAARTKSECQRATISQGNGDGAGPPSVSLARLGQDPDWGTMLFQYMFLKSFALQHRMVPEVPPWLGQSLFQERDEPIGRQHEVVVCDNLSLSRELSDPIGAAAPIIADRVSNLTARGKAVYLLNDPLLSHVGMQLPFRHADLDGPFVLHSRMLATHRDYLRGLLQPAPAHQAVLNEILKRLRERGKTLIGLHYISGSGRLEVRDWDSCAIPMSWYLNWLKNIWRRVEDPVLLLCTNDETRILSAFSQFNPISVQTLVAETSATCPSPSLTLPGRHSLTFIEWLLLTRCDVLAIANDLSSFTAAMMNGSGIEFWRPSSKRFELIAFEPWDDEPTIALGRRSTLAGELAQRIRLIRASNGRRALPANLTKAVRLYARILQGRLGACYQYRGGAGVLRELISPHFYLDGRRAYSTPNASAEATGAKDQ